MDGETDACMQGWMDKRMHACMQGWMDGVGQGVVMQLFCSDGRYVCMQASTL